MSEQLIRTKELCKRLGGIGKNSAIAMMTQNGVWPVCHEWGRGIRKLWLSSAVDAAILKMHENAQPSHNSTETSHRERSRHIGIADMSVNELFNLTNIRATDRTSVGTFGHEI